MRRVTAKNTKPEVLVRKFLYHNGFRYRCNFKGLPGSPDIFVLKHKVAIFIHGCLWHGHLDCKDSKLPKSNIEYWKSKVGRNMQRDQQAIKEIRKLNLKTITIWTCELTTIKKRSKTLMALVRKIEDI
jgi:DNA mismatch endonuclease (patch repair protein)